MSAEPPAKRTAGQIEKGTFGLAPKISGCWVSQYANRRLNVGWVECNETQQSMEVAQPNLRNAERPGIKPTFSYEVTYENSLTKGYGNSGSIDIKN